MHSTTSALSPAPDTEVVPGVKWGRPEWVPSPAYWLTMTTLADPDDDYVCPEMSLREQVGFCLLGGFGITAEVNQAAYDRLADQRVFSSGRTSTAAEIEQMLREPLKVGQRTPRYRFPRQRAVRIAQAMELLAPTTAIPDDPLKFRDELTTIPGIGPKTASWIVRNWLGSDEVAILDIHIIRAGLIMGLFDPRQTVPKDYAVMERRFMNEDEAGASMDGAVDANAILALHAADVLVVKRGPRGASVYTNEAEAIAVPAYRSDKIFKIGSGDVFSAAFAHYWGERLLDPAHAADLASRSVAQFVDGHFLPLRAVDTAEDCEPAPYFDGRIYLAGPFFDLGQRWLIEEALLTLRSMGAQVFSPLHEVGTHLSQTEIAEADLEGLRDCSKVLALLDGVDPGTIFEVGYARALELPVIALAERVQPEHLTMMIGSGCDVVDDFTTAVYRTLWARK